MPWRGPEYDGEFPTLGYLVADWIAEHLVIPDGDRKGDPFIPYDEQIAFLVWWYRLSVVGGFAYRRGQLMRSQKWGKGPLLAAIAAAEALGPVVPDGWDAAGDPVGRPWPSPWVQLTAVSEDQADNTYSALLPMLRLGPLANLRGLDAGETRVKFPGGRIQRVTASAGSRLGQRITFVCADETHLWKQAAGGIELARTQRRNLAGTGGRFMETTNAFAPGEDSVAERTYEAARKDASIYLNVRHPRTQGIPFQHTRKLRAELEYVYGDSAIERGGHVNLDRILADMLDPDTGESQARRFFLTELTAGEDQFLTKDVVDAAARPGERIPDGASVALGFDGSVRDDATGLIMTDLRTGLQNVAGVWARPEGAPGDWEVDTVEVDGVVHGLFDRFDVQLLYGDPWAGWRDTLGRWALEWPDRVREFDTTKVKAMAEALDAYRTAMRLQTLTHDGDPLYREHMLNAVIRDRGMFQLVGKDRPHSPRKIDLMMCGALSWAAYLLIWADGWSPEPEDGRMVMMP